MINLAGRWSGVAPVATTGAILPPVASGARHPDIMRCGGRVRTSRRVSRRGARY